MTKFEPDLVEIIRLYAPESELRSGTWKKDHGDCKKGAQELVSSCKHDLGLNSQAFFLRCPADRPKWPAFLAIDGATMEPKVPAHANEMHGPLEPFGTLLTRYADLSAANNGWAKMNSSGIARRRISACTKRTSSATGGTGTPRCGRSSRRAREDRRRGRRFVGV